MKKTYVSVIYFLIITVLISKAPLSLKYQAIISDTCGNVKANTEANTVIGIQQGSATYITAYGETHILTTDSYGLINIEKGKATSNTGPMLGIDCSLGSYFIKILVYGLEKGTSQPHSVTYALYTKTAWKGFIGSYYDLTSKPVIFKGARLVWGSPNYFFKGKLDDILIYNRPLTDNKITTLYNLANNNLRYIN